MASTVTQRFTWEQLKDIVHRGTNGGEVEALGVLGRCEDDLVVYRAHRANVLAEYNGINDYLRMRLFGAPGARNSEGKWVVAEDDPTTKRRLVLTMENEFPYFCDDGISHLNIWSSGAPLSDQEVEGIIRDQLPCKEHCWFVNPPQYQSVRTIWHAHVLCLNLKEGTRLGQPGEAVPMDASEDLDGRRE